MNNEWTKEQRIEWARLKQTMNLANWCRCGAPIVITVGNQSIESTYTRRVIDCRCAK